jgi:hypothetical protein
MTEDTRRPYFLSIHLIKRKGDSVITRWALRARRCRRPIRTTSVGTSAHTPESYTPCGIAGGRRLDLWPAAAFTGHGLGLGGR